MRNAGRSTRREEDERVNTPGRDADPSTRFPGLNCRNRLPNALPSSLVADERIRIPSPTP